MRTSEALPITEAGLLKSRPLVEQFLVNPFQDGRSAESILVKTTTDDQCFTLPEELTLLQDMRYALCLGFFFADVASSHTGLTETVAKQKAAGQQPNGDIESMRRFRSAFGVHVVAAFLLRHVNMAKQQESKLDPDKWPFSLTMSDSYGNDSTAAMRGFLTCMEKGGGNGERPTTVGDVLAVTRWYWKKVADTARLAAEAYPSLIAKLENVVYKNDDVTVRGFMMTSANTVEVITFNRVLPEEVVGDDELTERQCREMDRQALFDTELGKNPVCELGGRKQSELMDGNPGTGKTRHVDMMFTRLSMRGEMVGVRTALILLAGGDVKDEMYGGTGGKLKLILRRVYDTSMLTLFFVDDIDLLVYGDRSKAQAGDNDILQGLMNHFAGIGAGPWQHSYSIAATNAPTANDPALRQRFVYRSLVQGPESAEDFADLLALELRPLTKHQLAHIESNGYKPLSRSLEERRSKKANLGTHVVHENNWLDIGQYCAELRAKNQYFTGRSIRNAMQIVMAEAGDYDIPEEWFENPNVFRKKPYDERVEMLKAFHKPITARDVLRCLADQYGSESRYRKEAFEKEVDNLSERLYQHRIAEGKVDEFGQKVEASFSA